MQCTLTFNSTLNQRHLDSNIKIVENFLDISNEPSGKKYLISTRIYNEPEHTLSKYQSTQSGPN